MQTTLLSSAPSLDAIRDSISRFYCGQSKTAIPVGENEWKLVDTISGDQTPGVRIIRKRGRYRFERIHHHDDE